MLTDFQVFGCPAHVLAKELQDGNHVKKWTSRARLGVYVGHYKARLCADGSQQKQGIDYEENFAPVVAWSAVRLALVLATLLGLNMRQMDFTQAFPQAETSEDAYLHLPPMWTLKDSNGNSDYVIKLKKNLYGTATGARNWFLKLSKGLQHGDFIQSKVDPCLFLRDDCVVVVYPKHGCQRA